MVDSIEGGRPERGRPLARGWLVAGATVAVLAIVITAVDLRGGTSSNHRPATGALSHSPTPTCSSGDAVAAIKAFVTAWNQRDPGALAATLTPTTELDMSSRNQRALPPAVRGGFTSSQGIRSILRFARTQWRAGETLTYSGTRVFANGGYALNLTATFSDNTRQRMTEAKFVYDCAQAGLTHIVIASAAVSS